MYFKTRAAILPSFQPYENLQVALGHLTGRGIDPLVPWLLSYFNGSTLVGLSFGYLTDKSFALISKTDNAGSSSTPFFIWNDLHCAAFQNSNAAVSGA